MLSLPVCLPINLDDKSESPIWKFTFFSHSVICTGGAGFLAAGHGVGRRVH